MLKDIKIYINKIKLFKNAFKEMLGMTSNKLADIPEAIENNENIDIFTKAVGGNTEIAILSPDLISNYQSFCNQPNIKWAVIPSTIKTIEDYCFYNTNLQGINSLDEFIIPEGVENIGSYAFSIVTANGEPYNGALILPSTLKTIKAEAFSGRKFKRVDMSKCYQLTSIPNYLMKNGDASETGGYELYDLDLSNLINCKSIGNYAFGSNIKTLELPPNLETIGSAAFRMNAHLEYVKIPDSVINIANSVFTNCYRLGVIDFGNTRTTIPTTSSGVLGIDVRYQKVNTKIVVPDALYDDWIQATNWVEGGPNGKNIIIKYSDYYAAESV